MSANLSDDAKDAGLDAILALTNGGELRLYTGTIPASPDDAPVAQVLLVTLDLGSPAFAAASGGIASANAITPGTAAASGTATWGRLTDTGGNGEIDLTAGGSWVLTADESTDTLTTNVAHGLTANTPVQVFAVGAGTLPVGLSPLATYYAGSPSGNTLQLLDAPSGSVVTFSTNGNPPFRLKLAADSIALASADGSIAAGVQVSVASMTFRF